ncbi:helix-turn-helix domain-containing protein [Propionimicrobium sp. PCR01-08-3]|uniref:helix-turn-helix transcriptional regulator n=1 Tax=Propionimicrobium sp. PCR01-08-3 TaxID=3052086 RepID=UPI00255C9A13|nr:helix-turn-helix domain-containing protein [Propionimicrobium sp. PCR01-08-3]WIY81979.1 helix-turn-helix domain-containing protein [Propionimicrobium sp. PCR01-08-3]
MSPSEVDEQPHGLGPTRAKVLGLLEGTTQPVTVSEVANELDLHKNAARFHLDALVEAGFAHRAPIPTGSQGRPPQGYMATSEAPSVTSTHLLELTQLLLRHFVATSPDAIAVAEDAGREWGDSVAGRDTPPDQVLDELTSSLADRGFGVVRENSTLRFIRCPFRSAIPPEQLPLVCAIHRGFIEGFVRASQRDMPVGQLKVGKRICTVQIS